MTSFIWHVEGFDCLAKIYDRKIKFGCFSEARIQQLLMALAAKAGLEFDEIVGAFAKKRTKIATDLLSIHHDSRNLTYMCGTNPYFTARVIKVGAQRRIKARDDDPELGL